MTQSPETDQKLLLAIQHMTIVMEDHGEAIKDNTKATNELTGRVVALETRENARAEEQNRQGAERARRDSERMDKRDYTLKIVKCIFGSVVSLVTLALAYLSYLHAIAQAHAR